MGSIRDTVLRTLACDFSCYKTPRSQQLERLLLHAGQTVPHYGKIFRACGLFAEDSLHLANYAAVPPLERELLARQPESLRSSVAETRLVYWNTSGGSTGTPVRILQDRQYLRKARAVTVQQKNMWGYTTGDPLLKIWGNEREILEGKRTWRSELRRFLKQEFLYNAFDFNEVTMQAVLEKMNGVSGAFIVGYVQAVFELAEYILSRKMPVRPPRAVMVTAGVCYPEMRERIRSAFDAPVVDRYGSREVGNIACEQPGTEGLVVAPTCLLEVDTGEGIASVGEGDLLVTSLINDVMPLIRYRIGDRAQLHTDGEFQVLRKIVGRSVDMFKAESGALVDGEFFTHLLYGVAGVEKFQVIQRTRTAVEFILQAPPQEIAAEESRIERAVKAAMGEGCTVSFTYVTELPAHPSGKHRYTISEV